VIIEEPPMQKNNLNNQVRPYYIFPFSAKTKVALSQKVADMDKWLETEAESYSVEDISYTLLIGRNHLSVRGVFIARNIDELKQRIMEVNQKGTTDNYFRNKGNDTYKIEPILEEYGEQIIEELQKSDNITPKLYKEKLLILSELYAAGASYYYIHASRFVQCLF